MVSLRVKQKLLILLDTYKSLKQEAQSAEDELLRIRKERQRAECKRSQVYTDLAAKERKLEELEAKIFENQAKINELEKSIAECQRTTELLSSRLQTQDEVVEKLQNKAEEARNEAANSARTYSETIDKLRDLQTSCERAEQLEEKLQRIYLELEQEKLVLDNKLRKMKSSADGITGHQTKLDDVIAGLGSRIASANQRTREAEGVYEQLSLEVTLLEEEANELSGRNMKLRKQLDSIKATLQD